jgi:N-acetyl-gamma-glutamyl-phosphate reductase
LVFNPQQAVVFSYPLAATERTHFNLPSGTYPQTKWAAGTNLCYIGIEVDPRTNRIIVMSAIDNSIEGQAGQAVQCFNLMMGWEETLGLPQLSFYP